MHIVNFKIKPHDEHNLNTEFRLTLIHMLTFTLSNNSIIKFIYFDQLYYFFISNILLRQNLHTFQNHIISAYKISIQTQFRKSPHIYRSTNDKVASLRDK